jgi:hypothetical protein
MPFEQMGMAVTVPQFNHLSALEPHFGERLRQWGIGSAAPTATLILAHDPAGLAALTMAHGDTDFLVPVRYLSAVALAPHAVSQAGLDYFFLISRRRRERTAPPAWTCHM